MLKITHFKRLKNSIMALLFMGIALSVNAQLGGSTTYQFLNTPHNAKTAALGGVIVSYRDSDPGMVAYNPAALNEKMLNQIQFSESFYAPGVKYSSLNYVTAGSDKSKLWSFGIQNLSYEGMDLRDESGFKTGQFFANETALYATRAHTIGNYTIGLTGKYAQSFIGRFVSLSLLGDLGILYSHPSKDLNFGFSFKNIGWQVKSYSGLKEPLPFQVNAGITFKPEHMPLKMSITAHNLQRFNTVYLDPTPVCVGFACDTMIVPTSNVGQRILRHFNFAGDLKFSKNIHFRIAYSFQRRRELKLAKSGGAGFSLGCLVRIRNFDVEYGKIYYQFAGRPAYISITTNTDRFFKAKKATSSGIEEQLEKKTKKERRKEKAEGS